MRKAAIPESNRLILGQDHIQEAIRLHETGGMQSSLEVISIGAKSLFGVRPDQFDEDVWQASRSEW